MLEGGLGSGGNQADLGLLWQAGSDADTGATDLEGMLNDLLNHIGPMMDAEWRGQGGRSFAQVRLECEREMRTLTGALRTLGRKIGDTSIVYGNFDEDISTMVANRGGEAGTITNSLVVT